MKPDIQRYAFTEEVKIGFEMVDLSEIYARHKSYPKNYLWQSVYQAMCLIPEVQVNLCTMQNI